MSTTALLAELVIIGIQACTWMSLFILTIFGYKWVPTIASSLEDWTILITIISVSIFYTIGIIIDRLWDGVSYIFNPANMILSIPWVNKKSEVLVSDGCMPLHIGGGSLSGYLQYLASRLRIAQSTFFNMTMIFLSALVFTIVRIDFLVNSLKYKIIFVISCIGILLIIISLLAYAMLEKTYQIRSLQVSDSNVVKPKDVT